MCLGGRPGGKPVEPQPDHCDPSDDDVKQAETILRPYLTSGAVFGITASHRFRDGLDDLPFRLVDDISKAIASQRRPCETKSKT